MRSNADSLCTMNAHDPPRLARGGKPQAPNRKQYPKPSEDPRPPTQNQNRVQELGSVDGHMDTRAVVSSDLVSVVYDHRTMTLEIEFCEGGMYLYAGVPESIYQDLMSAPLKGIYYHDHIERTYPSVKVN